MALPYICARNFGEAHRFAREELGLEKGQYRLVASPSTISGRRGTNLYLVPGWERRSDRFALKSALRWTRLAVIDVAEQRQDAAPDDLEPTGEQLTAFDADAFLRVGFEDFVIAPVPDVEAAKHPEPQVVRRRRRCKECGLLIDPDEVDQHAAEHLPGGE